MEDERYYKDEFGNFILDKRNNNNMNDITENVYKLLAAFESMKSNMDTSLKAVYDKISNLDEKIGNKLQIIEKKVDDTVVVQTSISTKVDEHEIAIRDSKKYYDELTSLRKDYEKLKCEINDVKQDVSDLKIAPTKQKASIVTDILESLKGGFISLLTIAVVGFVMYLLYGYIKTKIGG